MDRFCRFSRFLEDCFDDCVDFIKKFFATIVFILTLTVVILILNVFILILTVFILILTVFSFIAIICLFVYCIIIFAVIVFIDIFGDDLPELQPLLPLAFAG